MDIRDRYNLLPEPIKMQVSLQEYMWLDENAKANLVLELTEPESFDD